MAIKIIDNFLLQPDRTRKTGHLEHYPNILITIEQRQHIFLGNLFIKSNMAQLFNETNTRKITGKDKIYSLKRHKASRGSPDQTKWREKFEVEER